MKARNFFRWLFKKNYVDIETTKQLEAKGVTPCFNNSKLNNNGGKKS